MSWRWCFIVMFVQSINPISPFTCMFSSLLSQSQTNTITLNIFSTPNFFFTTSMSSLPTTRKYSWLSVSQALLLKLALKWDYRIRPTCNYRIVRLGFFWGFFLKLLEKKLAYPIHFLVFFVKHMLGYSFELPRLVEAIQMNTPNTCFIKK